MKLFVGNTDIGWYRFLRNNDLTTEANFWRPSAQDRRVSVIQPGELFFFRLKSPISKIAGYGVFRHHDLWPLSWAWDTFGQENGCASRDELVKMIGPHRQETDRKTAGDWLIGCTVLSDLVFYPEELWLDMPLPSGIVRGKSFDIFDAEGARIWQHMVECSQLLALPLVADAAGAFLTPEDEDLRKLASLKARPRQGVFRAMVIDAYERRCCVTGERTLPVIDAAHITPYAGRTSDDVRNGLALRKDIHTLFDRGYVTVDDDYRFRVSFENRAAVAQRAYLLCPRRPADTSARSERPRAEFPSSAMACGKCVCGVIARGASWCGSYTRCLM